MAKTATARRGPTTSGVEPGSDPARDEIDAAGDVDLEDRPLQDPPRRRFDAQDGDDADDRKPAALEYEPDPRDALSRNFAKARATQGRELSTETEDELAEEEAEDRLEAGEDEGPDDPEVQIIRGPQSREVTTEPPVKARKVLNPADDDLVIVKVDGADVEMTFGEMKVMTQKFRAADNRLDEANRLVDEVRGIAQTLKSAPAAPANQQRPGERTVEQPARRDAPAGQTNAELRARLVKMADSLQTDVPEKAAEALDELASLVAERVGGQTNAPDVDAVVDAHLDARRIVDGAKAEFNIALTAVSEAFDDVIHDPERGDFAYGRAHKAVVENLRAIGVPEEDLRQNPLVVFEGYAKLRQDPQWRDKLAPMQKVFNEAARSTRVLFTGDETIRLDGKRVRPAPAGGNGNGARQSSGNQPARIVVSTNRVERKQGSSTQPRSASMRSDHATPRVSAKKDTSGTIASMRESRA